MDSLLASGGVKDSFGVCGGGLNGVITLEARNPKLGVSGRGGAVKVSEPSDARPGLMACRLRLVSLRRPDPPFGLVGVGGMSSQLDWLSAMRLPQGEFPVLPGGVALGELLLPHGEWEFSSPSMLAKL